MLLVWRDGMLFGDYGPLSWVKPGLELRDELHLTGPGNYDTWIHALSVYIKASGLRKCLLSEDDDDTLALLILGTIGLEPSRLLLGIDSGAAMLDKLESHYTTSYPPAREARDRLREFEYESDHDEYCSHHRYLRKKLEIMGAPLSNENAVCYFVRGTKRNLPDWFALQIDSEDFPGDLSISEVEKSFLDEF